MPYRTAAFVWFLVAGLAGGATAAEAPHAKSSPARLAAFARLPNWRGFWELHDIGASGTPTTQEVATATKAPSPSFTDDWLKHMQAEPKHNPETDRLCTFGFPMLLESSPLIFEIISVPEETAMIFNMREVRHIYTDGKGHTPEDIRLTTPWGDSAGHWEGQALVVDTIATSGRLWFHDQQGKLDSTILSDRAVYRERLRMVNADTLEDRFTVEDPLALSEPYRFTRLYHRIPHMVRVAEELDCETSGVNDRNPIVNGKWTLSPPKN
jgi:hypothetical protein